MRKLGIALVALALGWGGVVALTDHAAPNHTTASPPAAAAGVPVAVVNGPLVDYIGAVTQAQVADYLTALHNAELAARPHRAGSRGGGGCTEEQIIARESRGDPRAVNSKSGAGGLYQILPSTWAGRGGYDNAADAPVELQQEAYGEIRASNPRAWAASGC